MMDDNVLCWTYCEYEEFIKLYIVLLIERISKIICNNIYQKGAADDLEKGTVDNYNAD